MIQFIKKWFSRRADPSSKAESAPADETTPDEQSTDADTSTPSEPTAKPTIPATDEVELQRRFNEFERRFNERQKEILDARAAYIERWLVAISVVAVVGGYFGFTKFDKIEDEARQHVTAAKQHAEEAQTLVISRKHVTWLARPAMSASAPWRSSSYETSTAKKANNFFL